MPDVARLPVPERAKHFSLIVRTGLPHLWVVIAALTIVVGGNVVLAAAWGVKHLAWGLIIALVIIILVITEGSYREFQRLKRSADTEPLGLQRLRELAGVGSTMRARLPEKRGLVPLPADLIDRFRTWKTEVGEALAPWPNYLTQFRGTPAYGVSLFEHDRDATEIEQRTKTLQAIVQALRDQHA